MLEMLAEVATEESASRLFYCLPQTFPRLSSPSSHSGHLSHSNRSAHYAGGARSAVEVLDTVVAVRIQDFNEVMTVNAAWMVGAIAFTFLEAGEGDDDGTLELCLSVVMRLLRRARHSTPQKSGFCSPDF